MSDLVSKQKKEIKAWEGEKRAAIKKAKGVKGKKGKELLVSVEQEYETKWKELQERHTQELASSSPGTATDATDATDTPAQVGNREDEESSSKRETEAVVVVDDEAARKQKKQAKARRKREAKKTRERLQNEAIERETAESSSHSARQLELDSLSEQLRPLGLEISEIPSDGNCLYRAVAAQCPDLLKDYRQARSLCAKVLQEHEEEYAPFCEFSDQVDTFTKYVERVRSSSDWGGHLELRALSVGLHREIVVYCATQPKLHFGESVTIDEKDDSILLSYHLHYYALGEHYNQVVPIDKDNHDNQKEE